MQRFAPLQLGWAKDVYKLGKVDFYHKTRSGTKVLHHFSVADEAASIYFKLCFDADSLLWTLEEYMNATDANVQYESFSA